MKLCNDVYFYNRSLKSVSYYLNSSTYLDKVFNYESLIYKSYYNNTYYLFYSIYYYFKNSLYLMTLGILIVDSNASRNPYSVITIISFIYYYRF